MDARQLETVSRFSVLLEVLSDPEGLRKMIKDIKEVIKEDQKYLGLITTKDEADKYLDDAKKILEAAKEKKKADEEAFGASMKAKQDSINSVLDKTMQDSGEIAKLKADTLELNTAANSFMKQAKEKFENAAATEKALEEKAAALAHKEAELQEKADKIKQLMGM